MDSLELLRVAFIFVCTHWVINKISKARICMVCNREEMYAKKELWKILDQESKETTEEVKDTVRDDVSNASTEEMSIDDLDSMLEELKKDT